MSFDSIDEGEILIPPFDNATADETGNAATERPGIGAAIVETAEDTPPPSIDLASSVPTNRGGKLAPRAKAIRV